MKSINLTAKTKRFSIPFLNGHHYQNLSSFLLVSKVNIFIFLTLSHTHFCSHLYHSYLYLSLCHTHTLSFSSLSFLFLSMIEHSVMQSFSSGGPIGLFLVPAIAPQLVQHSLSGMEHLKYLLLLIGENRSCNDVSGFPLVME